MHVRSLKIKYQQDAEPLCVLFSFLSALHLYGDSIACDKLFQLKAAMLTADFNNKRHGISCPRMSLLFHHVVYDKQIKWRGMVKPQLKRYQFDNYVDIVAELKQRACANRILLVQLLGSDASTTHCVCIVFNEVPVLAKANMHNVLTACPRFVGQGRVHH